MKAVLIRYEYASEFINQAGEQKICAIPYLLKHA
jgi:hypothetical protein